MKVQLNTLKLPSFEQSNANQSKNSTSVINQSGQQEINELANFNSIGRSMVSFGSKKSSDNNSIDLKSKSIEELLELKETMQLDRKSIEEKKKEAQDKLDAISLWDYASEYQKQQNESDAEIRRKNLSTFWNPFQCHDIRQKHYNDFMRRNSQIDEYKSHQKQYQDIVSMAPLSGKQTETFISNIDDMVAQKRQIEEQERRIQGIQGIKNAIESMSNAHGGLDDRIAGYDYEKDELRRTFINPLAEAQYEPETAVPSSVMLYGASGTGKTTFLRGIKSEAKEDGYAHVVEMPATDNSDDFNKVIKEEFSKAKGRYFEEGDDGNPKHTRTVLVMNDAEKYFGMSYDQAKKVYGDLIDEADSDRLKNINHDTNIIDTFKSILDNCSGIPEKNNDGSIDSSLANAGLTIFITTNYPHLIDRDLIRKFDLMLPVNPAKNENLEEVMKFYFKKCSDVIDEVKKAAKNPDFKASDLKYVSKYVSQKSINKLIEMSKDGTLDELNIPWKDIPYDKIAKDFNPTKSKGAFDNMQLRDLSIAALNEYVQNPDRPYSAHYYSFLFNEPRKLDPVRYKHFVDIFNTLAPLNKQEGIDDKISAKREKELLAGLEKAGMLSDKDKKRLEYIRVQEQQEFNYLETKEKEGRLSDDEKIKLEDMRQAQNAGNQVINDEEDDDY